MDPNELPRSAAGGDAGAQSPQSSSVTGEQVKAQAKRLTDAVRERAISTSEDRKALLSEQVGTLAQKLNDATRHDDASQQNLPEQVLDSGVELMRRAKRALDENSAEQLIAKVEDRIRAYPGAVIAGCLALGFIGARLVRR